jgi:F-type H+-transporting ATPase subunit b
VSLNATLLGQMITFAIFVWFTMRYVWPMLEAALLARKTKIAEGLAAAQEGHKTLEEARVTIQQQLQAARQKASQIVDRANKESATLVEQAKKQAEAEKKLAVAAGQAQLKQERHAAQTQLHNETVKLALVGAEKILGRSINDSDHKKVLDHGLEGLGSH